MAGRLSELAGRSVLLLEAGPDYRSADAPEAMRGPNNRPLLDTDRFGSFWWTKTQARMTRSQEPTSYSRGKGLGGCSAVNVQVAFRGMLEDFDRWAADGCTGWSGQEVLSAFIRLEDDLDFGDRPYHGRGGPVPIVRPSRAQFGPVDIALADAAVELGYGWADDLNAPDALGMSAAGHNSRDGRRVSTNDAYLEPAREGRNLTIVGDCLVDRVLFDGLRAVGVRARSGDEWTSFAGDKVILCAGFAYSPAILLRSGIGPGDTLNDLGIPVVSHLPGVGANLQDHPAINVVLRLRDDVPPLGDRKFAVNCIGRFSSGLAGAGRGDMGFGSFNIDSEDAGPGRGIIFVTIFQPFSQGKVGLVDRDPDAEPLIEMDMLSDPRDLVRMGDGVRRLLEVAAHPAVQRISDDVRVDELVATSADLPTGIALDSWLLATCGTIGHPAGTCRMGAAADPRSVVDPECRVIGVEGLVIVDASIMPTTVRANNHLSCVMVAEHFVHRLKDKRPSAVE